MYYDNSSYLRTICILGALLGLIPAAIAHNKGQTSCFGGYLVQLF